MELLAELKAEQDANAIKYANLWVETDRLFTKWNGEPMNNNTPYDWLKEFCSNNGLPFYGLHSFRHQNTMKTHLLNCTNINYISLHRTAAVQKANRRCFYNLICLIIELLIISITFII